MNLHPSVAHRWVNCSAAPSFSQGKADVERGENDAAREGVCAAWVADTVLRGDATCAEDMVGKTHANGWFVDEEMGDHVQKYIDIVSSRTGILKTELNVSLSQDPPIYGRIDSACISIDEGKAYVDDLKYGYRIVEPWAEQCLIYGGTLLGFDPHIAASFDTSKIEEVQLGIFQPRASHPSGKYRTITYTRDQLIQRCSEIIKQGKECFAPNPSATPGPWCDKCFGNVDCVALTHTIYSILDTVRSAQQHHMDGRELGAELDLIHFADSLVSSRKDALEAEAVSRIRKEFIPGWEMYHGTGKRRWKFEPHVIQAFTGVNPFEEKLVSPKQMERMKVDSALVEALSEKPPTGAKLRKINTNQVDKFFNS